VTALPRYTFDELKNQPDFWSNANFKDAFPMVMSTLNWNLWNYLIAGTDQIPKTPAGIKGIKLYQGRAYWNLSIVQWVNYDAFGIAPRQINEYGGGFPPAIKIN